MKRHWPIHQPNLIPENQAEEFGLACSTHSVFLFAGLSNQKIQCQLAAQACSGVPLEGLAFLSEEEPCGDTVMLIGPHPLGSLP